MRKIAAATRSGIRELTKDRKAGDIVARLDFDPYYRSFRNSSTHVLAPTLDEPAIRRALKAGHAYVAHEWMCDATGFRFEAVDDRSRLVATMGDEVERSEGLKLTARLPVPAYVRLLRGGKDVAKSEGKADFEFEVKEPGAHRLEAWLKLDGEWRPWIFSNPIYVK
jgi:hypothetical protein